MKSINEKIDGYIKFWNREQVDLPLVGYDLTGFLPFKKDKKLASIRDNKIIDPDILNPKDFLKNYESLLQEYSEIEDDLIKGIAPIPAMPWLEAMMGCQIKKNGNSLWAVGKKASWTELEKLTLKDDNSWLKKYLQFCSVLNQSTDGNYPVGQPIIRGITDLLASLRGYSQSLIDGLENPDNVEKLAKRCTNIMIKLFQKQFESIDAFYGGYFIETFSLWAPDKIIRLQEDATAVYSPALYKKLIQESDRFIAQSFPYSVIHLHSSSLFLIDYYLEIKEINVYEINKDIGGMGISEMLPYFEKIQRNKRLLFIRGALTREDIKQLLNALSPTGLILQIIINDVSQVNDYKDLF